MSPSRSDGRVQPARPGDPKRVGPYRIIGRLGTGGMGVVHAGLDPAGLRVAVKVIRAAQAEDPEFRARFRREVQLSARVQGPCLIPVLAAAPDAESPWLATAYAPGFTLDQYITAHGALSGGILYAFATGTAQALAAIHAVDVVHRDVKPQNVILTPSGPRVLDFGIAHAADGTSVTRTGVMTGTPGWISPEHYRTGTAGPEGDVFTWGILIAYAATGRLPFGTGAPDGVAYRVMSAAPDLDGLPEPLRATVEKALAKEPEARPAANEIAELCGDLLATQATQIVPSGTDPTLAGDLVASQWNVPTVDDPGWLSPTRSSRRVAGILAAAAIIGGLTGGALVFQSDNRTPSSSSGRPHAGSAVAPTIETPTAHSASAGALAEAPKPSFVDSNEATLATWRAARRAKGEAEFETEAAIGHDVGLGVGEEYGYAGRYEVTFAESRNEIYIAISGPTVPPHIVQTVAKDACLTLRMMGDIYEGLPYDEYVLVDTTTATAPAIVWEDNFRFNTNCATQAHERNTAGEEQVLDWQPTESGLAAAQIPSTDKDEIRVAANAVQQLFTEWNGNSRLFHDPRYISDDNTSIGFAPQEGVMYVWATKPEWNQAMRDEWGITAGTLACRTVLAESRARKEWVYAEYAVAVLDGDDVQFINWGSAGSCTA
ncbi:serine/threonine-protein kinase [Streptomyces chartreusis]|uniref:serine/threonine-protein kinase n=1 Tax=Streptomyces chartreusis TaxID=1969 RepID=UPI0036BA844E